MFDVTKIRKDFPVLERKINGKPIIYLDTAASSLKPRQTIEAVNRYYQNQSANIFRGLYRLSEEATEKYETAREKIAQFIGAKDAKEIIFTRNTTESINLVAYAWGRANLDEESEIITTVMEHHSNLVPWQQLSLETGATIKYLDIDETGHLNLADLLSAVSKKTKILAITLVSNVLGTVNPLKEMIACVKKKNVKIKVLVDGAQAVPHLKVNVKDLGCDFFAFSGHKMFGPTGIGVLWGKYQLLWQMLPFQMGGEMVKSVSLAETVFKEPPFKFEAGTPDIAGAIGLGAAVDYLNELGLDQIKTYEEGLLNYALEKLKQIPEIVIYGPPKASERAGVISFNLGKIHPHDVASALDQENICLRSGYQCAMPLHQRLGIGGSCRATFSFYNTKEEIDKLILALKGVQKIFYG